MILSRLKEAIQEQNWFAVVLEVFIVVLGVVIGFQVTVWGGARQDAATAENYLHQLAADLETTEALMAQADEQLAPSENAANLLFESFRSAIPLSKDSVLVLVSTAIVVQNVTPLLGTLEALIKTGDLALLPDDSLKTAIPEYLEDQRGMIAWQEVVLNQSMDAFNDLMQYVDLAEADAAVIGRGGRLIVPRPWVVSSDFVKSLVPIFPIDAEQFRRNRNAYDAVYRMTVMKIQAAMVRGQIASFAHELHEIIETRLDQ